MPKTKEIAFTGTEIRISPNRYNGNNIVVEDPNSDEILYGMDNEDIIEWVQGNLDPEDVFPTTMLERWAEAEGYIKAETKNDE